MNRIDIIDPSELYPQWEGNKTRTDPPIGDTEPYWKGRRHSLINLTLLLLTKKF